MGILREIATGRRVVLPHRTLVGRTRQADLHLPGTWVSGEHATLWWAGRRWWVRDLDSRNGTLLEGQRVAGLDGQPLVQGQILAFGQLEEAWVVDDDGAPWPMAVTAARKAPILGDDGVLSLPADDDPQAVVYVEDDTWWIDQGDARTPTHDRAIVVVDGIPWTLRLPEPEPPTDDADFDPRPGELHLRIRFDGRREDIRADLSHRGARIGLDPRAHHEVLLLLAEHWIADHDASPAERGWLDAQLLADQAGLARATLNVHVQRLRRQFRDCGIVDPVIERRANHDLRLVALARLEVKPL